jgi:hypothetical protein
MLEIEDPDRTLESMVPEDMKRWSVRPCTSCGGTGHCLECKDLEKRRFLRGRQHRRPQGVCHACDGNKRCRACAGTGRAGGNGQSRPLTSPPWELSKSERVALILDLLAGRTSLPACRDRGLPADKVARWLLDFLEAGSHAVATRIPSGERGPTPPVPETTPELRDRLAPTIRQDD